MYIYMYIYYIYMLYIYYIYIYIYISMCNQITNENTVSDSLRISSANSVQSSHQRHR